MRKTRDTLSSKKNKVKLEGQSMASIIIIKSITKTSLSLFTIEAPKNQRLSDLLIHKSLSKRKLSLDGRETDKMLTFSEGSIAPSFKFPSDSPLEFLKATVLMLGEGGRGGVTCMLQEKTWP